MSLSYQPLQPVLVRDPITQVDSQRYYAILKGGNQVTWKKYTTTSISNSAINFSTPPPSGNIFVDRKQYMLLPVRLIFSGVGAAAGTLLNANNDAPRAFPLSGSLDVLQGSVNGQAFTSYISDIIHPLTHFNTDIKLHNRDYSLTPTYYDQSQSYADIASGNVRNPLSGYHNGLDHCPMQRGAFPFTVVVNTPTLAVVDMVICEPLFLSPWYFGCGDASGFYNVTTMDFIFTFLSTGNRFWSHNQVVGSNPITNVQAVFSNFTNANSEPFSYTDSAPLLLFKYITPDETQVLSPNMPITYPFYDVQRYPIDFGSTVAPGIPTPISSNNLQLNSVPRLMYVFARNQNRDLYAAGTGCSLTDTYLALENISITFANYTVLASASKQQLYQISAKNGCGMNWTQWSGERENNPSSFTTPVAQYGTIGSILAIEFATDIGLPSSVCPGLQGQYQLQVNAVFKNNSNVNINATLFIIIVSEGTMTIPGLNSCTRQLGVITPTDILNAQSQVGINYDSIRESLYGGEGNFYSNLKDVGSKVLDFFKNSKLISTVASAIPHPASQAIGAVARNMGYGNEGGIVVDPSQYHDYGGVAVGGRHYDRNELRNRLSNMY